MTREEMVKRLEKESGHQDVEGGFAGGLLRLAAAELRKTCATCQHWNDPVGDCPMDECCVPPANGSGFCYRWEPKP